MDERIYFFIILFSATGSSPAGKFFFPEPLSSRVVSMQPLIKPKPAWQPEPPVAQLRPWPMTLLSGQQMPLFNFQQQPMYPQFNFQEQPMYPPSNFGNTPFFSPQQMMMMPTNYEMEQYPFAPIAQAGLTNYFRQMQNNPQFSSLPYNQGLINYAGDNPLGIRNNRNDIFNNNNLNDLVRLHFIQQQRLNYNHERLLERYNRLRTPQVSEFRIFGTSSLPGRNYDQYLQRMSGNGDNLYGNSVAAMSRGGIGSSDETYRWMGDRSFEPLPRGVSSVMRYNRDDPMSFVSAEKVEPVKMYHHSLFGSKTADIRLIFKKIKDWKVNDEKSKNEVDSDSSDHEEETKTSPINDDDENEIVHHIPLGYNSYQNWETNHQHLIPVDPLLFNIYTQRMNGSIQSYGHSLYLPSSYHNYDRRPSHYEDIFTPPPSDTGLLLVDVSHEPSSSSKH